MGETTSLAAAQAWRANSLVQRLAQLGLENPFEQGSGFRSLAAAHDVRKSFALGLLGSIVLGIAAYLGLLMTGPQAGASAPPPKHAIAGMGFPGLARSAGVLDLQVVHDGAKAAPFPLLVTGLDAASDARVILHDLPESAWFSHGERRDEHTWLLRAGDLDDLRLIPRDGIPDVFNIGVRVIGAGPKMLAHASARVRFNHADVADAMGAGAAGKSAPAGTPPPVRAAAVVGAADWGAATHTRAFAQRGLLSKAPSGAASTEGQNTLAADTSEGALPPRPASQRPEGMSGLGAMQREAVAESRQLWWKMPLPAWAPFGMEAGRH